MSCEQDKSENKISVMNNHHNIHLLIFFILIGLFIICDDKFSI